MTFKIYPNHGWRQRNSRIIMNGKDETIFKNIYAEFKLAIIEKRCKLNRWYEY